MSSISPNPRLGTVLNDGTLGLVALAILLVAAVLWSANSPNVEHTDFALTYVGAHIVHSGTGNRLYDTGLQVQLRNSMFQHASPLYFEHPPFEAVILSPLAALPYRTAYRTWGLINVTVLLAVIMWLRPYLRWPTEDLAYLLLWLLFAPIGIAIYQGQSSIFVLAAFAAAFVQLKKGNPFAAGAVLGIGLLKFQFAVPMAVIFLFRRQFRFMGGFAASGLVLGCISLAGIGWTGLLQYIRLLSTIGTNPQNVSYGSAVDMPTLHGLLYALGGRHLGGFSLGLVVLLLSFGLLLWIALRWQPGKSPSFDPMFAASIPASLLSGMHMFTHDFSPLILGMLLIVPHRKNLSRTLQHGLTVVLIVFWAFPLYFLFVSWHCLYLMALPMIALAYLCVRSALSTSRRDSVVQVVCAG